MIAALTLEALSPEDYVRLAYLVLLRRPIDSVGLAGWLDAFGRGMFDHQNIIETLQKSDEFQSKFGTNVNERLHAARKLWIETLPAFDRLLDIGGSSASHSDGALIQLGYPHRPRVLDILDLPPDRQNWGSPAFDQSAPIRFDWGTVSYFHGCAEDVAAVQPLQPRVYDCVFLGQAVEHIRPEALPGILEWIHSHLMPGGHLIMDTPNRLVTRIQCPTWYIHPDHKLEYEPAQLEALLAAHGFAIAKRTGLVHLPAIASSGVYDAREFAHARLLHDDVDACYLFALDAVRN